MCVCAVYTARQQGGMELCGSVVADVVGYRVAKLTDGCNATSSCEMRFWVRVWSSSSPFLLVVF